MKGEKLPPLPPPQATQQHATPYSDTQATIRHAEPPSQSNVALQLDDDDEEEDYGELLDPEQGSTRGEPYPPMEPQHDRHMQELPETAMLDSVVLPAIASVRFPHQTESS